MKRIRFSVLLAVIAIFVVFGGAFAAAANYRAHLAGRFEVPLMVDTRAQGQAIFQLNADGTELRYKLIVANIENVFMAHIHLGGSNTNGPVVVWLYPKTPLVGVTPLSTVAPASLKPGRFNGVLAEGVITSANLVGPLAGKTLADLVGAIEAGNTYVNVHTSNFDGTPNTGAGDMHSGEVRGPIH